MTDSYQPQKKEGVAHSASSSKTSGSAEHFAQRTRRRPYHAGSRSAATPSQHSTPSHHTQQHSTPSRHTQQHSTPSRHTQQHTSTSRPTTQHQSRTDRPRRSRQHGRGQIERKVIRRDSTILRKEVKLPPVEEGVVRVIPLGGVEEVGKNMLAFETKEDIIISDIGFQFVGGEDAPGIDYILPNTRYLEERKDKIRAVFITHGHLDHIGGIPYIMERIGNPTIYAAELTALMIRKRQEEFPGVAPLTIKIIEEWEKVSLGKLSLTPFPVTHSIPGSMGAIIGTPWGNVVLTGDLKLEHENQIPSEKEQDTFSRIGKEKNILLIADSTNAERTGFSIPEKVVNDNIDNIIRESKGRLIIGTFASQFQRMIHIIKSCEKYGKKVVTEGRSIKTNIDIAQFSNLLEIKKGTIIPVEDIGNYPPDRIIILATGAQGEEFAALMRIATGKHRLITLSERDTVVLSSSVIPGNELDVQKLKDNLYRRAGKIIHYRASDVHSTGHGNTGELIWVNKKVNAKFFMPGYGYHSMLRNHAQAVIDAGFPKENVIIADNGMLIDIEKGEKVLIHKEKAPVTMMTVDGFAVGDTQEVVIRDRKSLSKDGMFVIIATLNLKTGKLRKSPDIISRGFVYLRESQELLQETRIIIKKTVEDAAKNMSPIDFDRLKDSITETVSNYLFQKTAKSPVVIPVILGL
ncbi:MAG: RNase J family beta-CASP ribonuclease [Patescibacteria group bacterium]